MCLLRINERFDVVDTLKLYSQELSLDFWTNRLNDTIFISAGETGCSSDPVISVEVLPAGTDIDRIVDAIHNLLGKINVLYNTSLSKLKMLKEIRGDSTSQPLKMVAFPRLEII